MGRGVDEGRDGRVRLGLWLIWREAGKMKSCQEAQEVGS